MTRNSNQSTDEILAVFYFILYPTNSSPELVDRTWSYSDKAIVTWRGKADEYGDDLEVVLRVIDLSSNRFNGKFPMGIMNLFGLASLNLSRNNLSGRLPQVIGRLNQLQSLDLSRNRFSGDISTGMSDLHFLSRLDLSYNKLSGKIPSGTQLQDFDKSVFMVNQALCGPPLENNCSSDEGTLAPQDDHDQSTRVTSEEDEFENGFTLEWRPALLSVFGGDCGILFFYRALRHAFFLFLNKWMDWFLVTMAISKARLLRTIRRLYI